MKIYTQDNSYFEVIDSERKAYWLGFLYADGCVYESPNSKIVAINLHKKDQYILEEFIKDIKSDRKVNIDSRGYADLRIGSIKMANDLIKLGCIPRKSLVLKFPTEDIVPNYLIRHFIRGYMDGDGCISTYFKLNRNRNNINYYCEVKFVGTYNMIDMIRKYFNSEKKVLGHKHSVNTYQISFAGRKYKEVVDLLYDGATIYLKRKKEKWDEFKKYVNSYKFEKYVSLNELTCYIPGKIYNIKYKPNYEDKYKSRSKTVNQYDLQGNLIRTWESATSAADKYNTTSKAIKKVCTGDRKTCCNFIWKYSEQIESRESKCIGQYDMDGNLIKVWDSCREAASVYNVTFQAIRRAIKGQYKTCCGYIWKYTV